MFDLLAHSDCTWPGLPSVLGTCAPMHLTQLSPQLKPLQLDSSARVAAARFQPTHAVELHSKTARSAMLVLAKLIPSIFSQFPVARQGARDGPL
eukprot:2214470-Amphidinium_carterae.1